MIKPKLPTTGHRPCSGSPCPPPCSHLHPCSLVHIVLTSVPWTCRFSLCTCYSFQQDCSSFISLHAGLLFTIQISAQKSPLQRGLCWPPIVSSRLPTLPPTTSPCFGIIVLITFWFYLVDLIVCLLSDSSLSFSRGIVSCSPLFLVYSHKNIPTVQSMHSEIQSLHCSLAVIFIFSSLSVFLESKVETI